MKLRNSLRRMAILRLLNKFQQLTAREINIGLYHILREAYKSDESLKQDIYAILRKMNTKEKLLERSNRKYSVSELGLEYLDNIEETVIKNLHNRHKKQLEIIELVKGYLI